MVFSNQRPDHGGFALHPIVLPSSLDTATGTSATSRVPQPGLLVISSSPPNRAILSCMLESPILSPEPLPSPGLEETATASSRSNPRPSSLTFKRTFPARRIRVMCAHVVLACLRTFVR